MKRMTDDRSTEKVADWPRLDRPSHQLGQGRSKPVQLIKAFYGIDYGKQRVHGVSSVWSRIWTAQDCVAMD
jgi:hypothetical protein